MVAPLRVLVVDDDVPLRHSIVRALRDYAVQVPDVDELAVFQLEEADTGDAALRAIETAPPDILLLDQKMPGANGLDILDRLTEQSADTLTIMITAHASISNIVTATKRGAYDFLAKPFTPAELRSVLRKATTNQVLARHTRRLNEERRSVRFQLIQILGHELKAPLSAVEGYLELLKDPARRRDDVLVGQCVKRSLFRIESMRKLVDDLLDMTRIESGRKKRSLAPVDLRQVAQEVIETWEPRAAEAEIAVSLETNGPCILTADRGEIEMLLNNLVSNAIKYNRKGGRVDVSVAHEDEKVAFSVADTGIGLSEEEKARLFGEFVRIKNKNTRDIAGSGLGLSIVKKLATLYDGDVDVQSTPEVGSTFTVTLRDGRA